MKTATFLAISALLAVAGCIDKASPGPLKPGVTSFVLDADRKNATVVFTFENLGDAPITAISSDLAGAAETPRGYLNGKPEYPGYERTGSLANISRFGLFNDTDVVHVGETRIVSIRIIHDKPLEADVVFDYDLNVGYVYHGEQWSFHYYLPCFNIHGERSKDNGRECERMDPDHDNLKNKGWPHERIWWPE